MKKILAFAGSNSSQSINHQLIEWTAAQLPTENVKIIKLTQYPLEVYSEDLEKQNGFSQNLKDLLSEIQNAHALIVSVNEHNSLPSAFFKNVLDWLSRIQYKFLEGKKILLLSTSPGRGGASKSLEYVKEVMTHRYNGTLVDTFSLPSFHENFSKATKQITNAALAAQLQEKIHLFQQQIQE